MRKNLLRMMAIIVTIVLFGVEIPVMPIQAAEQQTVAFPGADGGGKFATGGRGGEIYYVTNLNDSGAGSLRDAVSQSNRIVLFKVGGTIELKSDIAIKSNITIAGQTAPGGAGITVKNYKLGLCGKNIIMRFVSSRPGERGVKKDYDALGGSDGSNSIVDHCSFGWANDEQWGLYSNNVNATTQWSVIGPSNSFSYHSKGIHGFGDMFGKGNYTMHHNLLVHNVSRNFRGKVQGTYTADFVNNVIYNWGYQTAYGTIGHLNYVGNYLKMGPSTKGGHNYIDIDSTTNPENFKLYLAQNQFVDGSDKEYSDFSKQNWSGIKYGKSTGKNEENTRVNAPMEMMVNGQNVSVAAKAESADAAYQNVLKYSGAGIDSKSRPQIDQQVMEETRTATGSLVGARPYNEADETQKKTIDKYGIQCGVTFEYPTAITSGAAKDTDGDGMPDDWEIARGLNPNSATTSDGTPEANQDYCGQGYTNIEYYINDLTVNAFPEGTVTLSPTVAKKTEENVTQIPNTTRTIKAYDDSFLDVVGFGEKNIKSRIDEMESSSYRKVGSEKEFLQAIADAANGDVHVIEITADLNLGYLEVGLTQEEKKLFSFFSKYEDPVNGYTNPEMQKSGVSKLNISQVNGLTIFSKNGNKIKHTEWKLQKSANDIVIRNLSFDEMWQWDDTGKHKEVGWTFIKVNGATNVWIDHCSFTDAADGLIDLENGSSGVTISWCQIGAMAEENPSQDSAIYHSIQFMEQQYKDGKLGTDSRYYKLRQAGASQKEIMAYAAYHSKCHLVGSGDKDYCNYKDKDGNVLKDGNAEIQLTLAYNHYCNMGQRQPMVRQGVGHVINCYFDNSGHKKIQKKEAFKKYGQDNLARCINARNGACIAADTCVFQDIDNALIGAEVQGDDTANMNETWAKLFQNAVNHSLIVNSTITNDDGTYTGSSWDNNGDNLFTKGFVWKDKKSIGNWAWSSAIKGAENMVKDTPPSEPFTFEYDTKSKLPYTYNVLPLEQVKEIVSQKAGAGKLEQSQTKWCAVRQSDIKKSESGTIPDISTPSTQKPSQEPIKPSEAKPTEPSEPVVQQAHKEIKESYPVQKFRLGIGDTNRNINITGFSEHSSLNSWITNGEENEKWYLRYVKEGTYEIVNARTGMLITREKRACTLTKDTEMSNQRWHIEGVDKDFNGQALYYKITSVEDPTQALTFRTDGNRVKTETYTGNIYQKMKLNCDGLEGFAANCKVSEGEKAGTIGGLLGETVVVKTMQDMKNALVEKRPLTIVVAGDIDCRKENYDWRIEDDKTVIGAYDGNRMHDCKLRTNDYENKEAPSDNIILKNLNILVDTNKGMIALAVYSSKNIWVDHCTFHCDLTKEYDEVGKFIWVNSPFETERSDWKRSPDFITISYNKFENRFWGVAFGTQNGEIKQDRASVFYNVFDSVVQRCPQLGNGTMHVGNNYYVRNSTSINNDGMAQIKCGENCVAYSQGNRFENFKKESSGYWDKEVSLDAKCTFIDQDSYTNTSENGSGKPKIFDVGNENYTKTTWNPAHNYGYTVLSAYHENGNNDVKGFCTQSSGASTNGKIHYITDSDMKQYVKATVQSSFLKQPVLTDKIEEPEEPSEAPSKLSEPSKGPSQKPSDVSQPKQPSQTEDGSQNSEVSIPKRESAPSESSDIEEPSQQREPSKVSEPSKEKEPSKVSEPSKEKEPSKVSQPSEKSEPSKASRPTEVSRGDAGSEPSKEKEPSKVSQPSKESEPNKVSQPSKESEPSKVSQPSKESEPSKVSQPSKESEPSKASRPTEVSRGDVGSEPSQKNEPSCASEPGTPSKPSQNEGGSKSVPSKEAGVSKPEGEPSKSTASSGLNETSKPEKVQKIKAVILKKSLTLRKKQTVNVTIKIKPKNVSQPKCIVKSSNAKIVKIVKKEAHKIKLQAKKAGVAVITVKTTDGSKITKKLTVKVRPDRVVGLKAVKQKNGVVKLIWKKSSQIKGYRVECYDVQTKKWKKVTNVSKNKILLHKKKRKKPYQFRVYTYIKNKKTIIYSQPSKVIKVSITK